MTENRSERLAEIQHKQSRILEWMERRGYAGLLLRQQKNFYWATAGAGNPVIYGVDPGFQSLLFTRDKRYVISQQVEMPRLEAEETVGLGFEHVQFNWWEEDPVGLVGELCSGPIACDMTLQGAETVDRDVAAMRPTLTGWEVERFRALAADSAQCLQEVCLELRPGMSELEIGAGLLEKLFRRNVRAQVLLVGADDRVLRFRHPVPSPRRLERYIMIGLCAERAGLIVPTSRFVHFGSLEQELHRKYQALIQVAAVLNLSSRPGRSVAQAMQRAVEAYAENGFPGEWQKHYQGGVCGYATREVAAHPGNPFEFQVNQVLGWNPTITGTKLEDAFLITEGGLENLTLAASWPKVSVSLPEGAIDLPEILIR